MSVPPSDRRAASSQKLRLLSLVAVLILAAGGGAWWFNHHGAAASANAQNPGRGGKSGRGGANAPDAVVAVGVAKVIAQDAPIQIGAMGTVSTAQAVVVRPQVSAVLKEVHFKEGDYVRKGALLASLDDRSAQAALLQAQGQLERDRALLENAQRDLQRYRTLQAQNSIAAQQVDTQAALVRQYSGSVKVDQANVAAARVGVSYTRIVAPISGRAGLLQVLPGNVVAPSDAGGIVTIVADNPINVVFSLPEQSLAKVLAARKTMPELKAEAWDRTNTAKLADGILAAVDNQINTATGTLNLKAAFDNQAQMLFPNQFVNVRLNLGVLANAVLVPTAAIQIGKAGSFVYVVNADNTVSMTPVTTGDTSGLNTQILSGVTPGQQVVVDGLDKLRDGAKIQAVDRAQQNAAIDGAGKRHGQHQGRRGGAASATPVQGASGVAAASHFQGASSVQGASDLTAHHRRHNGAWGGASAAQAQ